MQLYLDSFGAFLSVRNGMFHIHMKSGAEESFAVRKVGAILLTAGTALSTDAALLAAENNIPVLMIDANTHYPLAQLGSGRAVSLAAIRCNQALFTRSPQGFAWAGRILSAKIEAQAALLEKLNPGPQSENWRSGLQVMRRQAQALRNWQADAAEFLPALVAERFRGLEGTASRHYFSLLGSLLPASLDFRSRSGKPAFDPFNAALNYLYGMLYTSVHLACLKCGLDPYMAVMHADQYGGTPTLTFDLIEPWRPWADEVAFTLAKNGALTESGFFRHDPADRGLWLDTTGKSRVIDAMLEFLGSATVYDGRQVRRSIQIDLEAQKLAVFLKEYQVS